MGDWKPGNPGDPCCGTDCEQLCFDVLGCGVDFPGVLIEVFETGVPGTVLASGTSDAYGDACFDLSAHASKSLSYRATPPDLTDFAVTGDVLIGNWCGRTVRVNMPPATTAGTTKHCCEFCGLETLPETLYVDGIDPIFMWFQNGAYMGIGSCDNVPIKNRGPWYWSTNLPATECTATVDNPYSNLDFTGNISLEMRCRPSAPGVPPKVELRVLSGAYRANAGGLVNGCPQIAIVEASSVTCSPFVATFDVPPLKGFFCPDLDNIWPQMTLVVSENP